LEKEKRYRYTAVQEFEDNSQKATAITSTTITSTTITSTTITSATMSDTKKILAVFGATGLQVP
jgi:hypothetical protein